MPQPISLFLSLFLLFSCYLSAETDSSKIVVVSISPYKFFIEAIAQNTLKVHLLVPPGTSFHDYEPTPKQMANTTSADLWFRVGENFETRAINALRHHNPHMQVVDLREGVDLITLQSESGCAHCLKSGADLHIWLSPRQVKKQAQMIAETLITRYPEHTTFYRANLQKLLQELDQLDSEISQTLSQLKNRKIMVAHPAYAYFARDYELKQFPIEHEGKDPSPKQLHKILCQARDEQIKTIFVQKEYGSKGASLIAKELNAKLVVLAPYTDDDYFGSLRTIANRIAEQDSPSSL